MRERRSTPIQLGAIGRAAHDVGLAALLGGNLFGRLAFHPAVGAIGEPAERGRVVNDAWRRYGTVSSVSLATVVVGWAAGRSLEVRNASLSTPERRLAYVKDALVAAVLVSGVATAVEGVRFAGEAPDGAVPLADGSHPAPETPPRAARLKRALNALGSADAALQLALVATNGVLAQRNHSRPPLKRSLIHRG